MMRPVLMLLLAFFAQEAPKLSRPSPAESGVREKSRYFAFVDREYILTIEVVKPGVPLLNFVSMSDEESRVYAKDIRFNLGNRKVAARLLSIETGERTQPMSVTSIPVHPRSSFGLRVDGDFGDAKEFHGATIRLGDQDFELVPLSSYDFENLALKINRINLGSPDFSDDWRVLKFELLGSRAAARRRN